MIGKSKELLFSPYTIITGILFLIFLVNPQLVFLNQNSDINLAPLHFLSIGFALFFFFLIFFLAFYRLLDNLVNSKVKRKINFFLIFIFCFIFISIASPVFLETQNNMAGLNHHINFLILLVNLLASFLLSKIFYKNHLLFKLILLAPLAIFFLLSFFNFNKHSNTENLDTISLGERNLIVISLDGIPGITFNRLIDTPENRKFFKDFINYTNSFSHGLSTLESIFTELYGGPNWKLIADKETDLHELNKVFKEKNNFMKNSYTYGSYNMASPQNSFKISFKESMLNSSRDKSLQLISSSFCSWGFCSLGKTYGNFWNYINKLFNRFSDERFKGDLQDFNLILQSIEKTSTPRGVLMGHFIFTHTPVKFDENCSFVADRSIKQDEKSVDDITKCAILSIKKIITTLVDSELYENSYIIFKSDHGKPASYYQNGLQSLKINGNNLWGYDRFRPFVLLKKPFASNESLIKEERPFFLSDLKEIYSLYNILGSSNEGYLDSIESSEILEQIKSKKTFIFIPENKESNWRFDNHIPLEVDRGDAISLQNKIYKMSN